MVEILERIEEDVRKALEGVKISKELIDSDLGNLLMIDQNPIDGIKFRANTEKFLKSLAEENVQILFNQLCDLQTKVVDNMKLTMLPDRKTRLPRFRSVPRSRPPTKWEQFSKSKGIQKRKKEKLVFDELSKQWKPRYGYRRADQDGENWMAEVPGNKDPNTDMFAHFKENKKERIAKNEAQRLKNLMKKA
ncbi:ribosome biogenesis regulatory protein homolog [Brevipalpus obovatus]|uniref:ribosome biogenesis regulatory protein homolog n=1 Tax=Brevipalpus obovatus TaxID=246614 RepID=UPI003D9F0FDA